MAKKEVSEQKANLYLLAIVAIVAVVGIVVLVLNSGGISVSTDDLSGEAIRSLSKIEKLEIEQFNAAVETKSSTAGARPAACSGCATGSYYQGADKKCHLCS